MNLGKSRIVPRVYCRQIADLGFALYDRWNRVGEIRQSSFELRRIEKRMGLSSKHAKTKFRAFIGTFT